MTATLTLGGVALSGLKVQGWALTAGVRPSTRIFEAPTADIRRIASKAGNGRTLDLVIASGGASRKITDLYLLATQPGGRPDTRAVLVGDERALWERTSVARGYNIRRRTGETRLVGEARVESAQLRADIAYAAWSLDGSQPWTAKRVVQSVLRQVTERQHTYTSSATKRLDRAPIIESLEIEAPGDVAVRRVLDAVGLEVTVDPDGSVVVFDPREDADEMRTLFAALGAPIRGTGSIALAERAGFRPSKIFVGFPIEGELRFDFQSLLAAVDTQSVSRADASAGTRDPRLMDNVLLSSEPDLVVSGTEVGPGTPVEVDEAMAAWAIDTDHPTPAAEGDLDDAVVRKHWLGYWDWLEAKYGIDGSGNPVEIWLNRLRALRSSYRSLFRLPRPWLDRMRSVRANRAALLDPETGTRAESPAYMQYIVKATRHGLAKTSSEYHRLGWVVNGYATDLSDAKSAPAVVTVIDSDQGLISVQLRPDPGGEAQELAPGKVDLADIPSHDLNTANSYGWWHVVTMDPDWSLAIVVSAIMGAGERYHYIEVAPDDPDLGIDPGESQGPSYSAIVSAGLSTARFAWDDAQSAAIVDAWFGFGEYPEALLSNREEVEAIARAQAAAIYDSLRDRLEGSASYGFAPSARVRGNVGSIEHSVGRLGHVTTTVAMRPTLAPLGLEHYLPESIQRIVRRIAQP